MKGLLNKQLKKYYHQVSRKLPYVTHHKKIYMNSLKTGVEDFLEENEILSMEEIYKQFGTVEELTEIYLESISEKDLYKNIFISKIFKCICALLVIFSVTTCIHFIYTTRRSVVTEAEIEVKMELDK